MARPRSRIADYLVYLFLRVVICFIQMLPYQKALKLAEGLAWLLCKLDRRHRLVAEDNLAFAFPGEYTDEERSALVRSVYRHFCWVLIEISFLPRLLHTSNWHRYLDLKGGPQIVDALLSGRPVFLVTAHFGNWELGGFVLGMFGFKTHAIARKLDNPHLNDFLLHRFRERSGQRILYKDGDFERIEAVLTSGGAIATLGDQDAGQKGLFVDFFNRPASTHRAIALLALEHGAPLVVLGLPRVGKGLSYEMVVEDMIDPEEYRDRSDAVPAMTQRFTTAIERFVQAYPEQYFWLHRRWKHQPKARTAKPTAAPREQPETQA